MDQAVLLIALGVLFLGGLAADYIGRTTRLPRVTILLLLGLLVGQSGLGLLPEEAYGWFEPISVVALTMVAFLLGADLTRENLSGHGRTIFTISLFIVGGTTAIVGLGLSALGVDPGLALILGAIASATAPAAIADVIRQSGIRNAFVETITGIVAIDDVWGLIVFSLCLAFLHQSGHWSGPVLTALFDIGGAMVLGLIIGAPAAFLSGRLKPGEPLQIEAFGIAFLTAGLALWLEVSFLVAGMTAGAVIANLARHHDHAFNEIERIELPFMILFFLLAGASLHLSVLSEMGWVAIAYITLRILARLISGALGARLSGVRGVERHLYGPALLPQAGVAVGMALVAAEMLPAWETQIVPLVIAATVVFELIGPPITLAALRRSAAKAATDRDAGGRKTAK
ncbi:cation:proton antiporter [Jannaschia seohaensis]|uniref:Kef-type K+ transport system membrane component KefB n=1 Tax=Jannaschia seohaensis TaxID=475081 RepID=A0A2Y9AY35_9RHOB|nr:cation:proton antiporter [Jannaschia seohaensis]PWJ16950.1 Kef-type K+ transport system membrane component KefB [Jannaschia seohaensis]SSA48178.1 Kef-type K+ transport system, membrane component KefB [Jannaschia seohaensis]